MAAAIVIGAFCFIFLCYKLIKASNKAIVRRFVLLLSSFNKGCEAATIDEMAHLTSSPERMASFGAVPVPIVRWYAGFSVLERLGYTQDIDEKDSAEVVLKAVAKLKELHGLPQLNLYSKELGEWLPGTVEGILKYIGSNFARQGFLLVNIHTTAYVPFGILQDDPFTIGLISKASLKDCRECLATTRFEIDVFTGNQHTLL